MKFANKVYDREFILSEKWKKTSAELAKTHIGNNIRFYIDTCTPIDIQFLIFVLRGLLITPRPNDTLIIKNTDAYTKNKEEIESEINLLFKKIHGDHLTQLEKLSKLSEIILNEILEKYLPTEETQ